MPERAVVPDAWIPIGTLGRPRGLAGLLWLHPHNEATEALVPGLGVRVVPPGGASRLLRVESLADAGKGMVVRLEGVATREAAEALRLASVEVRRRDFPPLASGEYYHVDLLGLPVFDVGGERVGEVLRVVAYPTVDALVIAISRGEMEIPVTENVVVSIDVAGGRVVVDLSAMSAE